MCTDTDNMKKESIPAASPVDFEGYLVRDAGDSNGLPVVDTRPVFEFLDRVNRRGFEHRT